MRFLPGILLPLFFAILFAIPRVYTRVLGHSGTLSNTDETLPSSLSYASSFHHNDSNVSVIHKRAHNLQIHHMTIHSFAVPLIQAASSLTNFYSTVIRECITNWVFFTPLYTLRISNGFFSLTLYGTGGPIPWALVAEVAGNMLLITQCGFTGTYDIWYVNGGYMSGDGSPTGGGRSQRERVGGEGVLVQFRIGLLEGSTGSVIVDVPESSD